ncbi:MAG: phytoene/squalene synthase family protein [Candidatus Anstonellales archaeon]
MERGKYRLEECYEYCKKITRERGSNFYLGFSFLPKEKRNAIFASYAFCRYADDIVDESRSVDQKSLLLKWKRALELCYRGKANHPITIALQDAVKKYGIPKQAFLGLIEGCEMDLAIKRYNSFEDLLKYCERVAVTMSTISLHIFGIKDKKAEKYGKYLSLALQLTNILRDVGEDAKRGRIYIPIEDLRKYGYSEEELFSEVLNPQFRRLMEFQVRRVKEYFEKAEKVLCCIEEDSRFAALLMGAVYAKILDSIEKSGYDVFSKTYGLSLMDKAILILKMMIYPSYTKIWK